MSIGLDTQRAFGWEGGTFNVSGWNIRGRNIATDNLLNLQTPSGILAANTTRLWEVWYQQSFLDGRVDVKIGQQSLDLEFMTSEGAGLFLNSAMGWPVLPAVDQYAGGPAYPLSSLGVRLRAQPGGGFTALLGVFADNPPGGPFDDDGQLRGSTRWGGNFNLRTGALVIGEIQYALNQPGNGDMDSHSTTRGLPGTYKLGFWYDSGPFPDQRFDTPGSSLADPTSTGVALLRRNNFSIYAVADQMVWRPSDDSPRSINVFAPDDGRTRRSQPGQLQRQCRPHRQGTVRRSRRRHLRHRLRDRQDQPRLLRRSTATSPSSSGAAFPVRGSETFIEVTYQFHATGWWQVQPDFQYVFNPGGGIPNPNNPSQRIGNEAIFGLRSTITF